MTPIQQRTIFRPSSPDAAGVISWVHVGDLHMTKAGEKNHVDLAAIVTEINHVFAGTISFVYLPGDVADDGSRAAYEVVRGELDRLHVPWCAIIGDHDVHEKSFANFNEAMSARRHYSFAVGTARFIAMNAFDVPDPGSFRVGADQLAWVKEELQAATEAGQTKVLLLHCYPTDLKDGGRELREAVHAAGVKLIDMGHTHYNELANDGLTLYSATRSTGQIEEGPVGYSVSNIDDGVVSWRFVELGNLPFVMITSPGDERLQTDTDEALSGFFKVRAKFWGDASPLRGTATLGRQTVPMHRVLDSQVWEAQLSFQDEGSQPLKVSIEDERGRIVTDEIRIRSGSKQDTSFRAERDQDNALGAWPEHGLLGTQLGPNKNGKKW